MWRTGSLFLTLLLLICSSEADRKRNVPTSPSNSSSYKAAVVEYGAVGNVGTQAPLDIIRQNWANYDTNIEDAASQGADIIVFPECGLTTVSLPAERPQIQPFLTPIPDPRDNPNPCEDTSSNVPELLRNISCAARQRQIYVVLNLPELSPCSRRTGCPSDGAYFYNTNIAFDRNGNLIARYRKFHLFVEPGFDVTPDAELVTFDTDFGVRFGMFICFDILFREPAVKLVRDLGVTDIAYSTAWFSELPYLTATQTQAAWAHTMDVNLLASGFDNPPNGNSGSGIYAGKLGFNTVFMPTKKTNKLLVANVEKKVHPFAQHPVKNRPTRPVFIPDVDEVTTTISPPLIRTEITTSKIGDLRFFQDDFRPYVTKVFERDEDVQLCHDDFCCNFTIAMENITAQTIGNKYFYRIGAFDGLRTFSGLMLAGIQVCGVFTCTNRDDINSCGLGLNSTTATDGTVFKSISIKGDFLRQDAVQMPSTLTDKVLPLPASSFQVESVAQDESVRVHLSTRSQVSGLLGFAIYNRVFSRDGPLILNGGVQEQDEE